MKPLERNLTVTAVALIGVMTLALAWLRGHQVLGEPGVLVRPSGADSSPGVLEIVIPESVLDYQYRALDVTPVEEEMLPQDTTVGKAEYARPNFVNPEEYINMNIVLMGTDRSSIHKPDLCLTGAGFSLRTQEATIITIDQPRPYDLPVTKIKGSRPFYDESSGGMVEFAAVLVYWFVEEELLTARHGERMWWAAKALLTTGELQRWAYVSVVTYCRPGEEDQAYERLKRFLNAAVPQFQATTGTGRSASVPTAVAVSQTGE